MVSCPEMVVGLGVDLVEWARVAKSLERWGDRFVAKLMDPDEAARLPAAGESRVLALALAVAGKEATSKALGTGWSRGVRWRDVVVEPGPPPRVTLLARAAEVARSLGSTGRAQVTLEIRGGLALGEVRLLS
jgi:holo-[acyl-carrier protein] synthase